MITEAFFQILDYVFSLMLSVFPESGGFPQEVHESAVLLGGYARTLDPIIPFDTLAQIIGLTIIVELAILAFKTFKWLLGHVPLVGGKG